MGCGRCSRTGSATLGEEQAEAREAFGYEPVTYVKDGQAKARFGKFGNLR